MEKGQITLFLIILIVGIIVAASISYYFEVTVVIGTESVPIVDVSDIQQVVSDCLRSTLEEGVMIIGWQGGYYQIPERSFLGEFTFIPIYWEGKSFVPTALNIERQLSFYIEDNLMSCLNVSRFQDATLSAGTLTAKTSLYKDAVHTSIQFPLKILRAQKEFRISSFESVVPYRMTEFLALSKTITSIYSSQPGYICMNCLDSLSNNQTRILVTPYFSNEVKNSHFRISIEDMSRVDKDTFRFALVVPEDVE